MTVRRTIARLGLTALVAALGAVPAVRADVLGISLPVTGVVCPVCAHSINMALRRVEGVKSVKVLMKSHVNLDVALHPRTWVDPSRLFREIRLVGYRARPDELKLRLRGTVSRSGDGLVLTLEDVAPGPVRFRLAPADARGKRREEIDIALAGLRNAIEDGERRTIEVEGLWRPARTPGEPASLLLTHVPAAAQTRRSDP
jgi:copper chaperone CopZ